MKGIRKLFFGLILMTLIGVGFKVDAKAAVSLSLDVLDGTTPSNFSNADAKLVGKFTIQDTTDFPQLATNGTASYYYDVVLKDSGNGITKTENNKRVTLKTTYDNGTTKYEVYIGSDLKYSGENSGSGVNPTLETEYELFSLNRKTVRGYITTDDTSSTDGTKKAVYVVSATASKDPESSVTTPTNIGDLPSGGLELKLARVLGGVYESSFFGSIKTTVDGIEYIISETDPFYMFENEEETFTKAATPTSPYCFIKWTSGSSLDAAGTKITDSKEESAKYKMSTLAPVYIKARYGTLKMTSISGKAGSNATATFTFEGYTGYADDVESKTAKFGSTSVTPTFSTTSSASGTFTVPIPGSASDETYEDSVTVTMKADEGGAVYKFDVDVYTDDTKVDLDTVNVTNGKTISLDNFISSNSTGGASTSVTATLTGTAGLYVNTTNFNTLKRLSLVSVTGKTETTKNGVSGIKVTNAGGTSTANVIVLPRPSIVPISSGSDDGGSLNKSSTSSSSSSTSPFTVSMPIGVYHNGITWNDVKKAKLVFHVSGKKDKEATLDITGSANDLTKSETVDSLAVSDIIDSIVGDDEKYTVSVTAYPMNGNLVDWEVPSDTVDLTAYRIDLDGSGGANYTVNGTSKSGHFYAVKGTTYTIKSTAKNSGDKFQNWDDSVFSSESGGSYKVLGARTFKANYNNGSSSSSSSSSSSRNAATAGEGMDDYDDVPKTGESKADIWILWSVLFVSILGAGFMIWKRFGLVRAIAEADEEVAVAEHKEEVKAKKKEKEDKIKMLKDLRNL